MSINQSTSTTSQNTDHAAGEGTPCVRHSTDDPESLDPTQDDIGASQNTPLTHANYLPALHDQYSETYRSISIREARQTYIERLAGEIANSDMQKTKQWYAGRAVKRLLHTGRKLRREYDNPHTALVSLRVSPLDGDGERVPPVLLYNRIVDAFNQALNDSRYHLNKLGEFEHARIVAGTDHYGTPHIHCLFWFDGAVCPDDFARLVETFVSECVFAPDSGKGNEIGKGTVTVRGSDQELATDDVRQDMLEKHGACSQAAHYLTSQIPHQKHPTGEQVTDAELTFGATADASSKKAWSFSNGCWGFEEPEPLAESDDIGA